LSLLKGSVSSSLPVFPRGSLGLSPTVCPPKLCSPVSPNSFVDALTFPGFMRAPFSLAQLFLNSGPPRNFCWPPFPVCSLKGPHSFRESQYPCADMGGPPNKLNLAITQICCCAP